MPFFIKKKYPDVEWNEAAVFRDILIHDHFGVDLEAVWDTIKRNIPSYKRNVENILKNEFVVINDKASKKP